MTRRRVALAVGVLFLAVTAWGPPVLGAVSCGEPAQAPKHQAGEKWTWRDETGNEFGEVVQAEGDLTQMVWPNKDVASHDKDLIIQKVSRPNGQVIAKPGAGVYSVVGEKTIDFPLQVGKKWSRYTMGPALKGGRGNQATIWYTYQVVACEEVSTPAGTFPAFKVEVNEIYGDRASTYHSAPNHGISHLWYAPQVKNYVKQHYDPSPYWHGLVPLPVKDYELVKFEVK